MHFYRVFVVLLSTGLTLAAGFCAAENTQSADEPGDGERLHALFEAEWDWAMRQQPTRASQLGDLRYNDRWEDLSLETKQRQHRHYLDVLDKLKEIEQTQLSPADRINLALFRREYRVSAEAHQHRWFLLPLTMRDGIQDAGSLADSLRFETVKDYEDWLARIRAFPLYMDQTLALMKRGIAEKRLHPKVVMKRVPAQIRRQIVDSPERSLFYKPFRSMPETVSAEEQDRLRAAAKQAIEKHIVPSYRKMLAFFEQEYLPACFERVGVWQIPGGQELYAFRARQFTTTELTPREIHEIGRREVKRIRGEMKKIIEQVEFKGTFREFLDDLRTNPRFYYEDPNELLKAYQRIGKRIDPRLPKLFGRLPKMPYTVEAIPAHMAPDTTTAYYRPPSADGRRPGTYFVNLYKPEVRPIYEIEALSLHEAVPGHHLQIALAMEQENLPAFRRYGGYTAFIEGWGLYAESLGEELGLYQDPYSRFGQLTYEMWRAVRLVVDTGMHAFGWTRQQAIDFFKENTAKTIVDIENEVDRYIAWPGQALAYKIGELKIKELRAQAERKLGKRFDIREFHDTILGSGAVTLDVLESNVENWLAEKLAE